MFFGGWGGGVVLPTDEKCEPELNGSKLPWYVLRMHFRMFPAQVFETTNVFTEVNHFPKKVLILRITKKFYDIRCHVP